MKNLLFFLLVLLTMPTEAYTQTTWDVTWKDPNTGVNYNCFDDGWAEVSSGKLGEIITAGSYVAGDITILSSITINGKKYHVTSIGEYAFYGCKGLTSVTIPNSVGDICNDAFHGCKGLTSVTIPNSVKIIRQGAFSGCSGLTSVAIGNSVTSIGDYAFSGCSGLTSVTIPNSVTSIGGSAFSYCTGLTSIDINSSVVRFEGFEFEGCSNLTSISIPDSLTNISKHSFEKTAWYNNQNGLIYLGKVLLGYNGVVYNGSHLEIKEGTKAIGNDAFSGCEGLTSVTIPNSVTSIGDGAFWGCKGLTSVTIPNSVTSIGSSAFSYCKGLTSVTIPNSVTSIGSSAFSYCKGLTSITIPNSVKSISRSALEGTGWYDNQPAGFLYIDNILIGYKYDWGDNYKELKGSVEIKEETILIGDGAFYYCKGLTSVTIPNSVTSIGNDAFNGCEGLTSVTIPNSVTSIGNDAFHGCKGLTSVTIPNSVTSIGNCAFGGCSGLTSVTIPNSVTSIGNFAFEYCSGLTSVYISDLDAWCKISFGDCSSSNPLYCAHHLFLGNEEVTELVIPNSVTSIGDYAFCNCSGLTSVTIPNSVTSIGNFAFEYCSGLTSVAIGNSVTSIGDYAFSGCSGLTSVTIPNSVTSIGKSAFYDCKGLASVTIPNSVTSISMSAFSGCELKKIYSFLQRPMELLQDLFYSYGYGMPVYPNCTLFVPIGTKEKYQSTEGWKNFKSIGEFVADEEFFFVNDSGNNLSVSLNPENKKEKINIPTTKIIEGKEYAVTSIGSYAFDGTNNRMRELVIPSSIKTISSNAFVGCDSLTSVYIEDMTAWCGIRFDDNPLIYAKHFFVNGKEVKDLVVPDGVKTIGKNTFNGCEFLTSITIPNSVEYIYECAFMGCCGLTSIIIPNSVSYISGSAFGDCRNIIRIIVESGNPKYDSRNNCNAIIETNSNKLIVGCMNTIIPNSVTAIEGGAFSGCEYLSTITIPNSVNSFGNQTFANCKSLKDVVLLNTNANAINVKVKTFYNLDLKEMTLKVPAGEENQYGIKNVWKDFGNIVGIDPTMYEPTIVTLRSCNREYGEENPIFDFDVTEGMLDGEPEIKCEAKTESDVGMYVIRAERGSVSNLNCGFINATLTVTKAPLKVTVKDAECEQGDEIPQFEIVCDGWKLQDDESVFDVLPVTTCSDSDGNSVDMDSPVGEYDITVSGGEAKNYELTYQSGKLTVKEPSGILDITISSDTYAPTYTLSGQRVDAQPKKKGVYVVNGRKVVVK